MDFGYYLKQQIQLHPSIQLQDVLKMCYQAVFGVEHMLTDKERARQYFYQEYEATCADFSIPLYEPISESFCRVNLAAWKAMELNPEELFELFIATAGYTVPGSETGLNLCANSVEKVIAKGLLPFSLEEWQNRYTLYKHNGMPAVHHSETYRQAEHPAYRIIQKSLLDAEIS